MYLRVSEANSYSMLVARVSLSEKIEESEYTKDSLRVRNKITIYGAADKSIPLDKDSWTIQAEKELRRFVQERRSLQFIAEKFGISEPAIRMKLSRLRLEVVDKNPTDSSTTTSKLLLPRHLPSIEKALKVLAAALDKSQARAANYQGGSRRGSC